MDNIEVYSERIDGWVIQIQYCLESNTINIFDRKNSYNTRFHYDDFYKMLTFYKTLDNSIVDIDTSNIAKRFDFLRKDMFYGNFMRVNRAKYYIDMLEKNIKIGIDELMDNLDDLNTIQLTILYEAILKRKEERDETSSIRRTESVAG